MRDEFLGSRVAIIGLARSGLACAEALGALGARVSLYDSKPGSQLLDSIEAANELGFVPYVEDAEIDYSAVDCVVTSPGVPRTAAALVGAVLAGVPVFGEIEAAYRIALAPILAITGTNGKTTTTVLVGEMLKAAGFDVWVAGNIAAGDISMPLTRAAWLAPADAVIVAEISSFQLEWIDNFRPQIAALLNITPDHGDRQSWEEYRSAKWRIFENQQPDDVAVLPKSMAAEGHARGLKSKVVEFDAVEIEAICPRNEIRLPGEHNFENILAAAAIARTFGVDEASIRRVATTFAGVVHRLEFVAEVNGVRYVNNSMCTNAAAFRRSLEALGPRQVLIMGGVWKGDGIELLADAIVQNDVVHVVLIGRSAQAIHAALTAADYNHTSLAATMVEAVEKARASAWPGQTVVLSPACASFDMFRDFEDRGDQFKRAVREL